MSLGSLFPKPIRSLVACLVASLGLNLGALLGNCLGLALVAVSLLGPIALGALGAIGACTSSIGLKGITLSLIRASF